MTEATPFATDQPAPAGGDVCNPNADPGIASDGTPRVSRWAATVILITVVVFWGFNWPVMKIGLGFAPPLSFAAIRFVIAFVGVAVLVTALGQLRVPDRRDIPIILTTGLLQVTGVALLIIIALQFVPPGRASILIYTTPLWVTPLALVLLHERLTRLRAAGLVVGAAGVAVLFNPLAFDWSDPDVILGNALLLLAAFAWAVTIVHVRGHRWHATPLQLLPWQLGIAVVVMVPLALALEAGQSVEWSGTLIAIVLYSGLIAAAYCNWGIITVNRALPATTTALLTLGVPVCGVLFSSAMVDEPLDATTVVGLSLILAGLTAVTLGERRRNGRTTAVPLGIAQDDAPLP